MKIMVPSTTMSKNLLSLFKWFVKIENTFIVSAFLGSKGPRGYNEHVSSANSFPNVGIRFTPPFDFFQKTEGKAKCEQECTVQTVLCVRAPVVNTRVPASRSHTISKKSFNSASTVSSFQSSISNRRYYYYSDETYAVVIF